MFYLLGFVCSLLFFFCLCHRFFLIVFFFSSRRRHTRWNCDWSSDVCSSDLAELARGKQPGEWIVTMPIGDPPYYFDVPDILAEKRWPTRHDLDAAAPTI